MKWNKFTTSTGLVAAWMIADGEVFLKVITPMERRFYYSAFNEAGDYFDEFIKPKLQQHERNSFF